MPIDFNSNLSSSDANNTFLDKTIDDIKTGKLTLRKFDGDTNAITDLQVYVNEIATIQGTNGEGDPNSTTYSSEEIIANGDDRKVAIGKLDAQAKANLDLSTSNESRVTDIENSVGQPDGLAELDATGKVPSSQLTVDAMEFKGQFDPVGGSPALADGSGNNGDYYVVSADGSYDFGSGSLSMLENDIVIYDGDAGVYIVQPGAQVRTVNGSSGDVTIDKTSVGLSNVTNDAQLKRSAGDFATFTEKATPVDADIVLIEDSEDSNNKKKVQLANLLGGGGAGGSTAWILGDIAPIEGFTNGIQTFDFDNESPQEIFLNIIVPDSYTAGDQIKLLNGHFFINNAADNVLFKAQTTLFKLGDDVNTNTNQHTSTNSEVTLSTADALEDIGEIDLTDSGGEINATAVAVGDLLKIRLYRDYNNETTSAAEDAKFLRYSASVSFEG